MATKSDFKAAQERIFARPRPESKSDQELLRKTADDGVYASSLNIKAIRIDRIVPDDSRPPHTYSDQSLAELGQSLLARGQMMPVLVQYQSDEDVFLLVDGERRWRAAQMVGLQMLQAIVLAPLSVAERRERRMTATLHQAAWDDEARREALDQYKAAAGLATWAEVARQLGVSEETIRPSQQDKTPAHGNLPAGEAPSHIAAAISLVDTLSGLRLARRETAEVVRLLDELADHVAAQRARLRPARNRVQPAGKAQEGEGATKPVRHIPTWDQR